MDEDFLYLRIAEYIRSEINNGSYKPGDPIPSIRTLADTWNCTNGTVQRAIRELESAGLVATHVGKRTRVTGATPLAPADTLQRANLIHRAETFLLESMTSGYTPADVEDAFRVALNRWRAVVQPQTRSSAKILRFSGSHDLIVAWMATHFNAIAPDYGLKISFTGSLPGLLSLQKTNRISPVRTCGMNNQKPIMSPLFDACFQVKRLPWSPLPNERLASS